MTSSGQIRLELPFTAPSNAYEYGTRTDGGTHGVVLTKTHVVNLILDLAGYTTDKPLHELRILEPSCGEGAFVVVAVERLLDCAHRDGVRLEALAECISAFDIDPAHVDSTREAVTKVLCGRDAPKRVAKTLANSWIKQGDFLLADLASEFDVVVGNPPYIRIEQIASSLQAEYRRRFSSLFDRADLYVAFIERSLRLLSDNGTLSFICADRWTANRYGAPLRGLITAEFKLRYYIDLHTASPFESSVIAYPSIFTIGRTGAPNVAVVRLNSASQEECAAVIPAITRGDCHPGVTCDIYPSWFNGDEPWVISSAEHLRVLRALEERFRTLENSSGTRVGIGVATGCDRAFIVGDDSEIEPDRLVPLVMREDIVGGHLRDARRYVINMFGSDGKTIRLSDYPRLNRHVERFRTDISRRHVAKKNPASWFRTIDRVYPELVSCPKLLIPDIAGSNEVAFDSGRFHPHHNLYFVTSKSWDLQVLGGLLSSRVALFFVWCYAVRMRGGYLRFQAQYLRRIRLPEPETLSTGLQNRIREAFATRDFRSLDSLALEAYGLDDLPDFDFVDTRK